MKHCIILHLYYQDLWPEFKDKIVPLLSDSVDLYVTVVDDNTEWFEDIKRHATQTYVVENRGADIGPFIYVYKQIKSKSYKTFFKIHGKKTLHDLRYGTVWRQQLYFGIADHYDVILQQTNQYDGCWMLGNGYHFVDMIEEPATHINRINVINYIQQAARYFNVCEEGSFFAGTMWLTNDEYLNTLFNEIDLDELYSMFEPGHPPASFAHGVERVLGYGVQHYGGHYIKIGN